MGGYATLSSLFMEITWVNDHFISAHWLNYLANCCSMDIVHVLNKPMFFCADLLVSLTVCWPLPQTVLHPSVTRYLISVYSVSMTLSGLIHKGRHFSGDPWPQSVCVRMYKPDSPYNPGLTHFAPGRDRQFWLRCACKSFTSWSQVELERRFTAS